MLRSILLMAVTCVALHGHAPPTPIPVPPLRVQGNRLTDAKGQTFLLRGVGLPGWESAAPLTYRVIRQRWNMNEVRMPLDVATWRRDGQAYLDRAAKAVAAANAEGLIVVLAAVGDEATGLPGTSTVSFWRAAAGTFKASPGTIFALYHEPVRRNGAGWREWRDAMQPLAAAIREAGAAQVIAAPSFQDALGFQGFTPEFYVQDANVIYEVHPYFDTAAGDAERQSNFGVLAGTFPVLAGAWGMPFGSNKTACTAIPRDLNKANDLLYTAALYFDSRAISWSVSDFSPGSLIRADGELTATTLDSLWTCDASSDPATGIGQFILLWNTGDPAGFGSLQASQIASVAGGFAGPVAAGEIVAIYGQGIGPDQGVNAAYDAEGRLPRDLGETQVMFDGLAAPLFYVGAFQVNVQVPWEIAGQSSTVVRLTYRGVASNAATLNAVAAVPDLLTTLGTFQAAALNQNGAVNDAMSPAERGSIVSFFAVGLGQTIPASSTGARAISIGGMASPVSVRIGGLAAEILYAGPAPGLVGVTQINARVPEKTPLVDLVERVGVTVSVGEITGRQGVSFWAK
ncbi:MAG: cellulase family glycosylhydrolase [Candidatus Solibacter sp.]